MDGAFRALGRLVSLNLAYNKTDFLYQMLLVILFMPLIPSIVAIKCPEECSCDDSKDIVGCVGKNLTHIPRTIDKNTVELDLRSNNLQMLSRGAFMPTPSLTHLNLQRCNIVKVKKDAFRALGRLVFLNLANNKIVFLSLMLLVILFMPLIPSIVAIKCPEECSCDDSKDIVGCVGKNLTHIPRTIDKNTVELDLRSNNLQMLSRGAFMPTPSLTHLNLQRCNIVKVKKDAFRALGRLVFLNLANNKIVFLSLGSFDGLSSLKKLCLDHNRIKDIQPGAFTQLGVLNTLVLTHNQLDNIPDMAFQGLKKVKWLDLSHNSLEKLETEAFAGLFTLSRLNLDHNELQVLPKDTMTRLREGRQQNVSCKSALMVKLTHLYLNHMSFQELSDQAFSQPPVLSQVDLSYNQLHQLEPLSGPKDSVTLNLTGNPIYCDFFLEEWATAGGVKLLGVCAGPPHLANEPLLEKEMDEECDVGGDSDL